LYYVSSFAFVLVVKALRLNVSSIQVAMCNFQTIKDAADVAIATMLSGIQVCLFSADFVPWLLERMVARNHEHQQISFISSE
jgi:hypothetical protein